MGARVRAGELRHRVDIQSVTITRDSGGGQGTQTWATLSDGASIPAEVLVTGSREIYIGQQRQLQETYRVRMRYRADVTNAHRLLYGSKIIDIHAALNWQGRSRELRIDGVERVAA